MRLPPKPTRDPNPAVGRTAHAGTARLGPWHPPGLGRGKVLVGRAASGGAQIWAAERRVRWWAGKRGAISFTTSSSNRKVDELASAFAITSLTTPKILPRMREVTKASRTAMPEE